MARSSVGKSAVLIKLDSSPVRVRAGQLPLYKQIRKGDGFVSQRQYITVNRKDHPRATTSGHVLLHILAAEEKLGRHLAPGETVHHLDMNKKNNSPENLIVFATPGDHTAFHNGCDIYKDGDVWKANRKTKTIICQVCGKPFDANTKRLGNKKHFCSNKCRAFAERKTIDTDGIISRLLKNNGNFTKTASELCVSGNALVHRLKRAGYPYHSKDYKI